MFVIPKGSLRLSLEILYATGLRFEYLCQYGNCDWNRSAKYKSIINKNEPMTTIYNNMNLAITIFVMSILLLATSCSDTENSIPDQKILAQIGDKKITINEFIKRSEYTLRPAYCRDNNYIHKKIVLNSLIGEKLLALESGPDNELTNNSDFQAYLEGRKEQAMRQVHFYEEFYKPVNLSQDQIDNEFKMAGRTYDISYFTIRDKNMASVISKNLEEKKNSFEEIYESLSGDTLVPTRTVSWEKPENKKIRTALFKNSPQKGELIGPMNINDDQLVFIKINGWTDKQVVTEMDYHDRHQKVSEFLKDEEAWVDYKDYVAQVMKNKRLEFYEDTFKKMVQLVAPVYLKSAEAKRQLFNNSFWQDNNDKEEISKLPDNLDKMAHHPFFSIDGRVWTIERFRAYLKKHPLVFRKEAKNKRNFAEQFKFAVVDMIRDYYITQDAYAKDYDKFEIVKREIEIWEDHMLSMYQKYKYLESVKIEDKDQMKIVTNYLTPYVTSLQKKYDDDIVINIQEFEKIELTNIDLIALRPDQPYPIVTPSFPLLTNNHRLDYGKMIQQ